MRTKLRPSIALPGLVLVLLASVIAAPVAADEPPGRQTFEAEKCGLCHGVAAVGIEATVKSDKMKGPDLSGFVHDDPAWVIAYIRQQETLDGAKHKRKAKASDDELQAMLDWLGSLEAAATDPEAEAGDGR